MKYTKSPRIGLAALLLAIASPAHSQTLDWGAWGDNGTGVYANGDSIVISGLVNGSVAAGNHETTSPHAISAPAFPYDNAPEAGEYGFFHNATPTSSDWSILIDLSGFTLGSNTVIGFSNMDGRDLLSATPTHATLSFLDSSGASVSISSASFLGSFDTNWQGETWDATSTFNLGTGTWNVIADSGSMHPAGSYSAAVGNAFFLTNLPTNIERIVYTKSGPTSYSYDSTLFYAGNVVPEPSSALLGGIAGMLFVLRRRRSGRDS